MMHAWLWPETANLKITTTEHRTQGLTLSVSQRRLEMTSYEESILNAALEIRSENKLPFWEALFCAALRKKDCRTSLLDAALFHAGVGETTSLNRQAISGHALEAATKGDARNIGLSSKVQLATGEYRHLAMLDFHCEISAKNTELVGQICGRVIPGGFVVVDSGDSYHAVSTELFTEMERYAIIGKALLLAPIVDTTYVAHQLQQPESSIRISKGGKMEKYPVVVLVGDGR